MTNEIDATRMPVVRLTNTGEAMADSRDVAAYFKKEHRNVTRAIETLVCQDKDWGMRNFEHTPYIDAQNGQTYHSYRMTRSGFSMLAMGFTGGKAFAFKVKYIEAFDTMESELRRQKAAGPLVPALPDFTNPAIAARAWAEQFEGREVAEQKAIEMQPKVAALDRIATADGSLCITEAAKALQRRPKDLFKWLRAEEWIYRRAGATFDLGYQSRVQAGLLEHKVTTLTRPDGSERIMEQVRVTPKGLTVLAKKLSEPQAH